MDEYRKIKIENNLFDAGKEKILDLSQQVLSLPDYEWLGKIIKRSSFIERIMLPKFAKNDATTIVSILHQSTIKNSTLMNLHFDLSLINEPMDKNVIFMHQQIQSRLQRNKKRIFAIHGGGNIGLGLMADVIAKSSFPYNIVATTNNQLTRNLINSVNKLWLQHGESPDNEATCISNVRMVSREESDVINLYQEACLAAICVTGAVIPNIAAVLAQALITRYRVDGSGLKILVLMNMPNCAQYVLEKINAAILSITKDEFFTKKILSGVEFIATVIDRIVRPIDEIKIKKQLKSQIIRRNVIIPNFAPNEKKIIAESTKSILEWKELIQLIVEENLKFNLFNAEKSFSMYVAEGFPEAHRFPAVKITKNLSQLESIKSKYINGPHAILAWAGALSGCVTIAESIGHHFIFTFIKDLMEKEIRPILQAEYPEISNEELNKLKTSFFERCAASTDDLVTRVGRDPLRKLDQGGIIRGTIELAEKNHLRVPTPRLEQGMAAGYLCAINGIDPTNSSCQRIKEIFNTNNNSFAAVLHYSGTNCENFRGLNPYKDKLLINRILNKMTLLNQWYEPTFTMSTRFSADVIFTNKTYESTLQITRKQPGYYDESHAKSSIRNTSVNFRSKRQVADRNELGRRIWQTIANESMKDYKQKTNF